MQPLVFEPLLKRIRWGGRRLGTFLGKSIGPHCDYAESWEVADLGNDQTRVREGAYAGRPLTEIVQQQNVPLLGPHAGRRRFPLLVKYLDASDTLSVQVHPDDAMAGQDEPDAFGKSEAWVILEAAPHSRIYVGFHDGVTESDVRAAVVAGRIEALLHSYEVRAGDCVYVPAGTVHAIGAGVLLAEIQQSSDATYRLYDWDRLDANGRPRPLHLEAALKCIDFDRGPVDVVAPQRSSTEPDLETLVDCEHFVMRRRRRQLPFTIRPDVACRVLMVLEGSASLIGDDFELAMPLGQTIVLPAERSNVEIKPREAMTLLEVTLP